jgi:hypothetical protein
MCVAEMNNTLRVQLEPLMYSLQVSSDTRRDIPDTHCSVLGLHFGECADFTDCGLSSISPVEQRFSN